MVLDCLVSGEILSHKFPCSLSVAQLTAALSRLDEVSKVENSHKDDPDDTEETINELYCDF